MAKDLVEYIVKSIVSQPEMVLLSDAERNGRKVLKVFVVQRDMARVMGSRGLVVRAIRTIALTAPHQFEDVIIEAIGSESLAQ